MHLVVDLANQVILPLIPNESLTDWMTRIKKRIQLIKFIAKGWKLKPIFVCDAGYTTQEVKVKWRSRRERELEKCCRKIPYCADTLVCELIMYQKLQLVFDKRYNADDIIATIAVMHPANVVLSRDMDYFRYDACTLHNRVFFIGECRKVTQLHKKNDTRTTLQTIRMYLPLFATTMQDFTKFVKSGIYMRGTAYPLAERSQGQSMHILTRKFRQLLYVDDVIEIFPVWVNNKVHWCEQIVKAIVNRNEHPKSAWEIIKYVHQHSEFIDRVHETTISIMAAELMAEFNATSLLQELHILDARVFPNAHI